MNINAKELQKVKFIRNTNLIEYPDISGVMRTLNVQCVQERVNEERRSNTQTIISWLKEEIGKQNISLPSDGVLHYILKKILSRKKEQIRISCPFTLKLDLRTVSETSELYGFPEDMEDMENEDMELIASALPPANAVIAHPPQVVIGPIASDSNDAVHYQHNPATASSSSSIATSTSGSDTLKRKVPPKRKSKNRQDSTSCSTAGASTSTSSVHDLLTSATSLGGGTGRNTPNPSSKKFGGAAGSGLTNNSDQAVDQIPCGRQGSQEISKRKKMRK